MYKLLEQYLITFGWAVTGAISMAISLGILVKVFSKITPVDEWEEIKKGNVGMAIIIASIIIGTSFVVGLIVMP